MLPYEKNNWICHDVFLAVTVVFGKSQENVIDITFNKLGAVYHKNESGNAVCKVIKANNDITYEVVVEIVDIDKNRLVIRKRTRCRVLSNGIITFRFSSRNWAIII